MGFRQISLDLPVNYQRHDLESLLHKHCSVQDFSYSILSKSLDARNKRKIHWVLKVQIISPELPGANPEIPLLEIPRISKSAAAVVTGSGPAGFFAAQVLLKAGFEVTLLEQGSPVEQRLQDIQSFEARGQFHPASNYAFGEGGAGTFSDGKLTSRTKQIEKEKQYMLESFVQAGAPEEILYLAHPHVGSNLLQKVIKNLRLRFQEMGGTIHFFSQVQDFHHQQGILRSVRTGNQEFRAQEFVFAPGHSHTPTLKLLMRHGVRFRHKGFAIGMRAEHPQSLINEAQWGKKILPGLKAAEYRLASQNPGALPVYTFCMCPGGKVVPAAPFEGFSVVNGVSDYERNSPFANAAVVAGITLPQLLQEEISPLEALEWLESLEKSFYSLRKNYEIPAIKIKDFLNNRASSSFSDSSFPFALFSHDFKQLLPDPVRISIQTGLMDFSKKIRGYDQGILMGLESKTSSPIQVEREKNGLCTGFSNLYLAGEGGGYAGGITSSAVDGIKTALGIIQKYL